MRMKRIAAALTAAVMAVSLAACSNNADPAVESSQPSQTDTEPQAIHLNLAEKLGFPVFLYNHHSGSFLLQWIRHYLLSDQFLRYSV